MDTPVFSPLRLLQSALPDFSEEGTRNKIKLLEECSLSTLNGVKVLQDYHNTLLVLLSYPDSELVYERAEKEMARLTATIAKKGSLSEQLTGSGIGGTATQGAYSPSLISWLIKEFPASVSLHSFDDGGVHPKDVLKFSLPPAEFELLSDERLNPVKWLEKASGVTDRRTILHWLADAFENMDCNALIKDQLFESLKLFIEIKPADPARAQFSKSYNVLKINKRFYHGGGIIKKFDEAAIINKKLPSEKKLSIAQRNQIIKTSRVALCLLNRETDPITYCNEGNIKYYELERGLSVALFSMDAERRMPLESYIGFMMFKNGYPMAYGGAWLFGKRSLIGINIFEAFRGGESAMVFAQLLRCYHKAFGADYFEVEPYQFGKNNPEGIQSGAFWFYYRFGFKPCDSSLYQLSVSEAEKIRNTRGYRTPAEVLKQFTKSNLFVHLAGTSVPINPSALSKFITHKINTAFSGNRVAAQKHAIMELKKEKIISGKIKDHGRSGLSLFFAYCVNTANLTAKEKQLLGKALSAKAANEFEYIKTVNLFSFEKNLSAEAKQFLL